MVDIKTGWKSKDWECIEPRHFVQQDNHNCGVLICLVSIYCHVGASQGIEPDNWLT